MILHLVEQLDKYNIRNMKNLLVIIIIGFIFFSCNKKDYSELYGKWSFNSKDGSYGEFWIDSNNLLLIDDFMFIQIYKYKFINDTIMVLESNGSKRWEIYIQSLNDEKLLFNDEYRNYDCTRISSEVKIDTSSSYQESVYNEVGNRLKINVP